MRKKNTRTGRWSAFAATWMLAVSLAGLAAGAAHAGVTYSYTGANFNLRNSSYQQDPLTCDPAYTCASSDHISFTFTLPSALAASSTRWRSRPGRAMPHRSLAE